jgi:hypothetical protein
MSLELSPQAESILQEEASRAGVSVDTLIERTFAPRRNPVARVQALLTEWQQQDKTPTAETASPHGNLTPSEALFRKWEAEDAGLTEEEQQAQAAQWEQFQRGINAERKAAGMRLIF